MKSPLSTCQSAAPWPHRALAPTREPAFPAREKLAVVGVGVLLALVFCAYYLQNTAVLDRADPRLLAQFRGERPFQLRILMPLLAHWGARLTALDVVRCYQLLLLATCLAFFPVFSLYLRQFCPPRAAGWLALLLAWPLFGLYSHKWFYPYDVPAALFATWGLLLMVQRRWAAYLLVFALATLNRETSAFLTLAFVLTLWNVLPRRQFALLVASQVGIWLAIRTVLGLVFASNAGSPLEWHFESNWLELGRLLSNPTAFALGGLATLGALWILGWATRRTQPEFLRRARGVFPFFLLLMSVVGVLTETRLYSELIPLLLAPTLIGVFNLFSPRFAARAA